MNLRLYLRINSLHDVRLLHVIEALCPVAERDDAWKKRNMKAFSTIILCVHESQLNLVQDVEHAKTAWGKLKQYHERSTIVTKVQILRKLCTKKLEEEGDMKQHINGMEILFSSVVTTGLQLHQIMQVILLLTSLPKSYENLVTALCCIIRIIYVKINS